MDLQALTKRLEIVEQQLHTLAAVPSRLDAVEGRLASLEVSFLQLREEVGAEFSAVRAEMRDGWAQLRQEMRAGQNEILGQMRTLDDERRAQTLALHEDVISRIALLGEHEPDRNRNPEA